MASPTLESIAHGAASRFGAGACRPATSADVVSGVSPAVVLEPADVAMLGDMLRWANEERLAIVVRGAGTKLSWGKPPSRVDAVLSTARLNAPIEHTAGDLTASLPAGATLAEVNALLGREGQWLPIDPRFSNRATIGGILAANDSGPRRHRHGTPRDLVIGTEMTLVDGRFAKSGGRVVKNVAGYDLSRLLSGSFGTLAVITRAIFKLAPLAPASRTVVASADGGRPLADLALQIASSPLTPTAIELQSLGCRLLVRFETTDSAASQQASAAVALCRGRGIEADVLSGDQELSLWRDYYDDLSASDGALVRVAVLPAQVADALDHVERVIVSHALECRVAGRAAVGVIYVRVAATPSNENASESLAAAIDYIRRNAWARGGSAVVVSAEPSVLALVDPWGDVGDALPLMEAVKTRFDPNHVLARGRTPWS
jgi:glycolate dehydrogenase FAD-binding subunit